MNTTTKPGAFKELLRAAVTRLDGWVNLATNVGTNYGRSAMSFQAEFRLSDLELDDIYHGDGYAARICDVVPEEALRRGLKPHTNDAGLDTAITSQLDTLGAAAKLQETWIWARVFGGAVLWVGADDGLPPEKPLNMRAIQSVKFLTVVSKPECSVAGWYDDPLQTTFGTPSHYRLARPGSGGRADTAVVHASRMIRFDGAHTSRRRRALNQGWSESELQRVLAQLTAFTGSFAATSALLAAASQGVLKMKDLMAMMAQDTQDRLRTRLQVMDETRSVANMMIVDADGEDFDYRDAGALAGLPPTLQQFMLYLSGVAKVPVTVLMGQSPAGLTATGESDIRWFYDRTASSQANTLKPRAERLMRILFLAKEGPTGGVEPAAYEMKFPPLWQPTPAEEADLRNKVAQTDQIYINAGVVTPDEIGTSRFREEGWNAETAIDLGARKAAQESDAAGENAPDPTIDTSQSADVMEVVARVGRREIDRSSGVGILTSVFGMTPEKAEAVMGETGRTAFTTPPPEHDAALADAQGQVASMQKSHASMKAMLKRVLARNKAGELVVGSPVGSGGGADVTDEEIAALEAAGMEAEPAAGAVLDASAAKRLPPLTIEQAREIAGMEPLPTGPNGGGA